MPAGEPPPTSADSKPRPAYKVFVSSTYRDNEERRRLVQDAITNAGMLWHSVGSVHRSLSQDCLDLSPGESFQLDLAKQIVARDVFLMFCWRIAAVSPWIVWKYATASDRKGDGCDFADSAGRSGDRRTSAGVCQQALV